MSDHTTWEEVLKRKDMMGRQIQIDEDGFLLRGPIKSIEIKKGHVHVQVSWMARRVVTRLSVELDQIWEYYPIELYSVRANTLPIYLDDGRIIIPLPLPRKGFLTLFPKSEEYDLKPENVNGLPANVSDFKI